MTEREYREHPAISRSELFKLTESPEKFRYYKDNPPDPTPALIFGQAFHKLALQPETFYDEFAVLPRLDRRTKAGKEEHERFLEDSADKTLITQDEFDQCQAMCEALYKSPYVSRLLSGIKEQPYFWTDAMTGEECKCRPDCISEIVELPLIIDLKSATSADTDTFMRDAVKYGYDFQSAMYIEGVKANTGKDYGFVFIVIEKTPPYAVNILQADELFLRRGKDLFRALIGIYHDCRTTGNWFGYLGKFNVINNLGLPVWLAKEIE